MKGGRPMDTCRNWLWPSEVADLLHVSRATVYRWIESGVLPTILKRRPLKVPRWAVVTLITSEQRERGKEWH